jgi:hypothetical protein
MVDLVTPLHKHYSFTVEGCVDDERLDVHMDIPHLSFEDSILGHNLPGARVFINLPWGMADIIGQHFAKRRRTAPESALAKFAYVG